jgi:Ala-tRNA(Pro) deacylase
MTTLQRCLDFLDNAHICYAHTRHSVAFTAMEVAFAEHLSPHKLAKTVVFAAAQGYGLAVLPADYLIYMDTLPECELGAMPPLGNLFHLPVLVDNTIAEQEFIAFSAGTHRDVIHMHFGDFRRMVDPAIGQFAYQPALARIEVTARF